MLGAVDTSLEADPYQRRSAQRSAANFLLNVERYVFLGPYHNVAFNVQRTFEGC